ncbi:hypothetical protein B0H12DRAFT_1109699 [Mycena haematopus]|nr:hypothetical protein B0H12DRAFT_1109699 [Mycena haematopus]
MELAQRWGAHGTRGAGSDSPGWRRNDGGPRRGKFNNVMRLSYRRVPRIHGGLIGIHSSGHIFDRLLVVPKLQSRIVEEVPVSCFQDIGKVVRNIVQYSVKRIELLREGAQKTPHPGRIRIVSDTLDAAAAPGGLERPPSVFYGIQGVQNSGRRNSAYTKVPSGLRLRDRVQQSQDHVRVNRCVAVVLGQRSERVARLGAEDLHDQSRRRAGVVGILLFYF